MAQVTFVQQNVSGQVSGGANVAAHGSAAVGDMQIALIATGAGVTPATPAGWTLLGVYQRSTGQGQQSVFYRFVDAANIASAIAFTWTDFGRLMVRTYRGATTIAFANRLDGLIVPAVEVPPNAMLVRSVSGAGTTSASKNVQAAIALSNNSLNSAFTWYGGISAGDEPGPSGAVAPTRTHTGNGTASVFLSVDIMLGDGSSFSMAGLDGPPLTKLGEYNAGAKISWTHIVGASGYEYRINGGSVTALGVEVRTLQVTGLTNDVAATIEVRAVNSGSSTATNWSSINVTPRAGTIYDDFNRANVAPAAGALGNAVSGQTWASTSGTIGILNGETYNTVVAENIYTFDVGTLDFTVEWTHRGNDVGGLIRHRDGNNYVIFQGQGFYRKTIGVWGTVWDNGAQVPLGTRIKVAGKGKQCKLWINGVLKATFSDDFSIATDTRIGIRHGAVTAKLDDFLAYPSLAADFPATMDAAALTTIFTDSVKGTDTEQDGWLYKGRNTKVLDSGAHP